MCLHRKHFIQTMGNCFGSIDQDYQTRRTVSNSRSRPTYSSRSTASSTFTPPKQEFCQDTFNPHYPPGLVTVGSKGYGTRYKSLGY